MVTTASTFSPMARRAASMQRALSCCSGRKVRGLVAVTKESVPRGPQTRQSLADGREESPSWGRTSSRLRMDWSRRPRRRTFITTPSSMSHHHLRLEEPTFIPRLFIVTSFMGHISIELCSDSRTWHSLSVGIDLYRRPRRPRARLNEELDEQVGEAEQAAVNGMVRSHAHTIAWRHPADSAGPFHRATP